jgi:Na+/H+-dicarboxylate symporter
MVTAAVFFLVAAIVGHGGYTDQAVTTGAFVLTLVGFCLLTTGGWLGGAITYVHGMRVLNLVDEPAAKAVAPVPTDEKVEAGA